jgi:N-acetylglutamate synthase-like GNAT family acetyltransferase
MTKTKVPASFATRIATHADRTSLVRLINEAFKKEADAFYKRDRMDLQMLDDLLASGEFIVVEEQGEIIACTHVKQNGDRCLITTVTVSPTKQGMGLGRFLIEAGHRWALDHGCTAADGIVNSLRQELVPFYMSLGYHVTGEAPFPYPEEAKVPCHFILFGRSLP